MKETDNKESVEDIIVDTGFINYILGGNAGQTKPWDGRTSHGTVSPDVVDDGRKLLLGLFRPSSLSAMEKEEMMNRILNRIKLK